MTTMHAFDTGATVIARKAIIADTIAIIILPIDSITTFAVDAAATTNRLATCPAAFKTVITCASQ